MIMDTFLFGVGRSGTTITYRILQEIYSHLYGKRYDSIYEPFIWNTAHFNDLYENTLQNFGKINSLSIDGIYAHLNLKLFAGAEDEVNVRSHSFFERFRTAGKGARPRLTKLIRGNGRMGFFRALNPGAKFILIIRNPVDAVNSVKHKFSYFGDDFYPSDFPRFCNELGNALILNPESATWAQKQAEYSYQMSRAALEFAITDSNTLVLEYNSFCADPEASIAELCCFLDSPLLESARKRASMSAGPRTGSIALSNKEFIETEEYLKPYRVLCQRLNLVRPFDEYVVLGKYEGKCFANDLEPDYEGLTTNRLRNIIRQKENQITQLKQSLKYARKG